MCRMAVRLWAIVWMLGSFLTVQAQEREEYNLLWRVEGNGLTTPSYLFGTMHVKDARAFNFSDSVMLAIERADVFALEVHPDSMMNALFAKGEDGLLDRLIEERINSELSKLETDTPAVAEPALEEGVENDSENTLMDPMRLSELVRSRSSRPDDKPTFVDAYLMGIAKTLDKEIVGLEEVKVQVDILNSWLYSSPGNREIPELEDGKSFHDQFVEVYADGNLSQMREFAGEGFVNNETMVSRNKVMANSMVNIMSSQSLFAAVGAGHLMGEQSVVALLREKGYVLSPVEATFTGVADTYTMDFSAMRWPTHRDKKFGYSIQMPGTPNAVSMLDFLHMEVYPDLASGVTFFTMVIDLRNVSDGFSEEEMIDNISAQNNGRIMRESIVKDGMLGTEVHSKVRSQHMRMQVFVKNNIFYGIMAGGDSVTLNADFTERYFESFKVYMPEPTKSKDWQVFKDEEGAFSILIPSESREMNRTVPNPLDSAGDPYEIKMRMVLDMASGTNYLFSHNDMPNGYHLQGPEYFFTEFRKEIESTNEVLGEPDSVWLDGYPGREYTLKLGGQFYSKMRVYVRGNRVYKLIKQNVNTKSEVMREDDYFESFSFLPYKKPHYSTYSPDDEAFTIRVFPQVYETESKFYGAAVGYDQIDILSSTNGSSGGNYLLEYFEPGEYFNITGLDSYYNDYIELIREWSDSLVVNETIQIDGFEGREFVFENRYTGARSICRTWLGARRQYLLTSHVSKEEANGDVLEYVYESFKEKDVPKRDWTASHAVKILEEMSNSDTAIANRALGAFSYHYFSASDTSLLVEKLFEGSPDDTSQLDGRSLILGELGLLEWSPRNFAKCYHLPWANDNIKSTILESLRSMPKGKGHEQFIKLFIGSPPQSTSVSWRLLLPFSDSFELAKIHFPKLMELTSIPDYRSSVFNLVNAMLSNNDCDCKELVSEYYPTLIANANADLDSFIVASSLSESSSSYKFLSPIYSYLNFMEQVGDEESIDAYTQRILNTGAFDNPYLKRRAAEVRILRQMSLDKGIQKELLSNEWQSFELLRAYQISNRLDEVSKKYLKPEKLTKARLNEYIYYQDDEPVFVKLLGTITHQDSVFYIYSFDLEYASSESNKGYVAVVGAFSNGSRRTVPYIRTYSDFEPRRQDWESQALDMLEDFYKWGY